MIGQLILYYVKTAPHLHTIISYVVKSRSIGEPLVTTQRKKRWARTLLQVKSETRTNHFFLEDADPFPLFGTDTCNGQRFELDWGCSSQILLACVQWIDQHSAVHGLSATGCMTADHAGQFRSTCMLTAARGRRFSEVNTSLRAQPVRQLILNLASTLVGSVAGNALAWITLSLSRALPLVRHIYWS